MQANRKTIMIPRLHINSETGPLPECTKQMARERADEILKDIEALKQKVNDLQSLIDEL